MCCDNKALQCRAIRVSETFTKSRSSDGAQDFRRNLGVPLGAVSAADWGGKVIIILSALKNG